MEGRSVKTEHPGLRMAVTIGLITQADADAIDEWAEELAKQFTAGEITEAEKDRRIIERLQRDLARRGQG